MAKAKARMAKKRVVLLSTWLMSIESPLWAIGDADIQEHDSEREGSYYDQEADSGVDDWASDGCYEGSFS